MRKESVKDRLEQDYLYHFAGRQGYFIAGSLPRQGDTTKWYDYSPVHNHGTITNATWTKLSSGLWVNDYDGTGDYITFTASALLVKTFMAWVYIDTKNKSIVDLDNGTHSVESDNSATAKITATGWASPTIYVNGVATDVVGVSAWKHIAVTTSTGFAMSALRLGKEASEYDGKMGLVFISSNKLVAGDILEHYQTERNLFQV